MQHQQPDHSLGDGVYFAPTDYIGAWRRLLILAVDTTALFVLGLGMSVAWDQWIGDDEGFTSVLVAAVWLYLVPLKRSTWRTVGYRLAGAKLVNLKGQRPALWLLTLRSILWVFCIAPGNFLFELLWCGVDRDRQSIRDRITNTCLVKQSAIPIGTGEIHLAHYFAYGYLFGFAQVVHPKPFGAEQGNLSGACRSIG